MASPLPLFDSTFLAKLEQLHLLSRRIFRGQQHADRRTRQIGSSLEFADYRNYTIGDDLRTVDWNIYGRLNRLFIKLFEAEKDIPVSILIDCSASMGWLPEKAKSPQETKFDHARKVAASLAYIGLSNLDRVNLYPFASTLKEDLGFVRGKGEFHNILKFLSALTPYPEETTDLRTVANTFSQKQKRKGLVFVVSDCFDPEAETALRFLQQQRFQVSALQVLHDAEINPNLGDDYKGDLELVDVENGTLYQVQGDESLLKRYQQEFQAFVQKLEQSCKSRAIGFLQTTTATPFEDLVLRVLRASQLVQ